MVEKEIKKLMSYLIETKENCAYYNPNAPKLKRCTYCFLQAKEIGCTLGPCEGVCKYWKHR